VLIKGGKRGGPGALAKHVKAGENETVRVIRTEGIAARDIEGALAELDALGAGLRTTRTLYHASINPEIGKDREMTDADRDYAVATYLEKMGLEEQPYILIQHEKFGEDGRLRRHWHVVSSLADLEHNRAIRTDHNYRKHEEAAREIERHLGHEHVQGAHVGRNGGERPERTEPHWQRLQEKRGAVKAKDAKTLGAELWNVADSGKALKAGLEAHGWQLARGDKTRADGGAYFMAMDPAGGTHELRRMVPVKAKELYARMADIDAARLPSVDQAKTHQLARAAESEQRRSQAGRYDAIQPGRSDATVQPDYAAARGQVDDIRPLFEASAARAAEPAAPIYDRDAAERRADEKIIDAAIAADKEPRQQGKQTKAAERDAPAARGPYADFPTPEPEAKTEPEKAEPALGKTAGMIRAAFTLSRSAGDLEEALTARGITLAEVSEAEAQQSQRVAAFAKEVGSFARVLRAGEIVAVNEYGDVYRLDARTTGEPQPDIEARFPGFDRDALLSVTDAKEVMQEAARASRAEAARNAAAPTGIETTITNALAGTMTGIEFAEALDKAGLTITRATETDVRALDALREQQADKVTAWENNERIVTPDLHHFAALAVGDYAAVTRSGDVFRLNPKAVDLEEAEQRLADVQMRLPSVVEARTQNEINREKDAAFWTDLRAWNAEARQDAAAERESSHQAAETARDVHQFNEDIGEAVDSGFKTGSKISSSFAKAVETILGGVFSFFGGGEPKLTPLQRELQARANEELAEARERKAEIRENDAAQDWIIDWQRRREAEEDDRERAGRERERERDRY
jgi:MobA/VirD2-like, nuclease domain